MELPIEWLPAQGDPEQLILLLHGRGGNGRDMAPLAQALRAAFPQAALLAPDAPQVWDGADDRADRVQRRMWFSTVGFDETSAGEALRVERVAAALPALHDWVRATQQRLRMGQAQTCLAGFSQGAILGMETALAHDGLAGRVLAFAGRFAKPPTIAPRETTLHLFHGGADPVIPAQHARDALEALGALQGDATLDIAEEVGHELHPVLAQRAIFRLRNHIPARTWAAALGAALSGSQRDDNDEDLH